MASTIWHVEVRHHSPLAGLGRSPRTARPTALAARRERILASVFGRRLDLALADGADPLSDRLLAIRAEHLSSRRQRRRLADGFRGVIDRAERAPRRGSAAPIALASVRANLALIRELADWLDSDRPAAARGIAAAGRLLTDGASPLWVRSEAAGLRDELEAILIALGS